MSFVKLHIGVTSKSCHNHSWLDCQNKSQACRIRWMDTSVSSSPSESLVLAHAWLHWALCCESSFWWHHNCSCVLSIYKVAYNYVADFAMRLCACAHKSKHWKVATLISRAAFGCVSRAASMNWKNCSCAAMIIAELISLCDLALEKFSGPVWGLVSSCALPILRNKVMYRLHL